ncbi:MAG: outer membrane protein assembly factor BamA [Rickettsiales bacterium]|jgi:outer membrane protein insertion porin family|nr:outer membrane protein assembly factor BamA [Rickettsiales bacterium]
MKKFLSIFSLLFITASHAEVISKIVVSGNKRIDTESVVLMTGAKPGDNITPARLNQITKSLQKSGYFEEVSSTISGGALKVAVAETPVVGRITIEGNDEISTEDLKKEIRLTERNPFGVATIGADTQRILTLYQRHGFFDTKVEPQKIITDNGRVDIVYQITEGHKTRIRDIDFEGNKAFGNRTLRGVVMSREYAWWKFMASFDSYDADRIDYDMQLLRQFYLKNGYADVQVSRVYGRLSADRRDYSVKFKIVEGPRFKFGAVDIENPFPDVEMSDLKRGILFEPGDIYNLELVENTMSKLRQIVADKGYAFINIDIDHKKHDDSLTIDLAFKIKKSPRMYLNDIVISGNSRTFDFVVNRHLMMKPKDPFSLQTIEQSRQRLMRTGYFKSVDMAPTRIEDSNLMNLNVNVQEQPTGELSGGLGWSNINGFMIDAGITERNFMGRGQIVAIKAQAAQYQDMISFSFTEPYLWKRALSGGFDVNYVVYDYKNLGSYGYNRDTAGITGRLGWLLTDNWTQQLRLSGMWDHIQDLEAKSYDTSLYTLGSTLRYSNLNTDFQQNTHTGLVGTLSLAYTGFGGTETFVRGDSSITGMVNFLENRWQLKSGLDAGYLYPLQDDYIARPYRYFLGGETLRGFDNAGVGSRNWMNRNYAYGGLWKVNGSTQLNFPIFIPDEYQVKGFVFADYGVLGKPPARDEKFLGQPNLTDEDLRASYGFGIYWNTPMGPMNFSWGYPFLRKHYDRERRFLLSFETQF